MGQCVSKCFKPTISSDSASVVVDDKAGQIIMSSQIPAATLINKSYSTRSPRVRIIQNFTLLWLDSKIDQCNADFENSLTQLRRIVNTIDTFTNPEQCVDVLTRIKNEKAFMLVSGDFSQLIVPLIHDMSQLDSIYIFCANGSKYEQWATEWRKVMGIFTQLEPICDALKRDTQQCDQDSIMISVTSKDLNHLEPSFMYTQLLKEILLGMEYDNKAKTKLVEFCREQFYDNPHELQIIDEFEKDYQVHTPIWWYTCECFTYQMLNRALRLDDVEIIIKMGFFLRDVHRHLEELHSQIEQNSLITVYRGKSMSTVDFDQIKKRKDGLLAFNTFLSTSLNEEVSIEFAQKSLHKPESVGVLFQITVDPSISSTLFSPISAVSAIPNEEEILFSMHTVFRIGQINQIQDRLWRVELTLTTDDDQELKRLTEHMRQETLGSTRWERLGHLLIKMGNFDKAGEIFQLLLADISKHDEKTHSSIYCHLGDIKCNKGNYEEALEFYQKSLEIRQKSLQPNHSDLVSTYNSIGLMHDNMAEYSKVLDFYQKSLEIGEKSLPSNQINLAETYNNIGAVYCHMSEFPKALDFYQKSLEICLESLPSNHPDLATIYDNIAQIHDHMHEYSKALESYQKSLEIRQNTLPPNHPDLAKVYNNIGLLHCNKGEFTKALEFLYKDLKIKQKSLPQNHPNLAITYNNIGLVHQKMEEYSKALEFYQMALEINFESLPPNHPDLANAYKNIGLVHNKLGDYSKALEFLGKSLEIEQKSLPSNHPNLAYTYNHIGLVYWDMGEYRRALEFYQKTLEISLKSLPPNHPILANTFNIIGLVHIKMKDYPKALEFLEKSLEIKQTILPSNHPDLANTHNHIGLVYWYMGEFLKALPFYERAVEIGRQALPENHPHLQSYQNVLAEVQRKYNSL